MHMRGIKAGLRHEIPSDTVRRISGSSPLSAGAGGAWTRSSLIQFHAIPPRIRLRNKAAFIGGMAGRDGCCNFGGAHLKHELRDPRLQPGHPLT